MNAYAARFALLVAVLAVVAAPAFAQSGATLPAGKVAVIDISVFPDRITELKRKIEQLNTRFEPRSKEVQAIRDSMTGIENQVKQGNLTPAQTSQLSDRYTQLKLDYERKSEDLTNEARKAYAAEADPLNAKLSDALRKFATERGIILILEAGSARSTSSVFYANPTLNITDAFVDAYNKANP